MRAPVLRLSPLRVDIALSLLFALFAHAFHAFQFNRVNNFFHIPIVLDWHLDPLFAGETFVQALQTYATPFYFLLRPVTDADNIEGVFHLLFSICRGLTLFGLLQVARGCGLSKPRWIAAFAVIVVMSRASYGASPVGDGNLFTNYMTHSEFAHAFALTAIGMAMRDRPAWAGLSAGLAFALNAFIGVWTLVPVGGLALIDLIRGGRPQLRRWLLGAACFTLPALPVAVWIYLAQSATAVEGFDYRAYLQFYYGYHFFIGWASWDRRLQIAFVLVAGLAATFLLLPRWRPQVAWCLFASIFLVGIVVGQIASSRTLLNLHMLRSAGMLMWLTIAAVVATCLIRGPAGSPAVRAGAVAALAGLAFGAWWIAAAAMAVLAAPPALALVRQRREILGAAPGLRALRLAAALRGEAPAQAPPPWPQFALAAAVLGGAALLAWTLPDPKYIPDPREGPTLVQLEGSSPIVPQWLDLKTWVARNTPPEARFIIPLEFADFMTGTKRRIWVAISEGGTAPWAPRIYHDWRRRLDETAALQTEAEAMAYARRNGVDYIVFDKRPRRIYGPTYSGQTPAVFENEWFAVVPVPR